MTQLELIDVEGELGVVLPDKVLSRLGVMAGGELVLAETPSGYLLTTGKRVSEGNDPLVPGPFRFARD